MSNFNKVILMGNLTRDPELRYTPKGTAVAKVGLAINRKWRDDQGTQKEEVCFVDVDLWGKTAENVGQYMHKGSSILVEGRLKLDTWDDKASGQKRSKLGVVGETVQFIGGTKQDGQTAARSPQPRAAATATEPVAGDGPPESDDVPF